MIILAGRLSFGSSWEYFWPCFPLWTVLACVLTIIAENLSNKQGTPTFIAVLNSVEVFSIKYQSIALFTRCKFVVVIAFILWVLLLNELAY